MTKIIGVRFRTAGKVYFFDPGSLEIRKNDHVIVETARGIEYGTVVGDPREVEEEKVVQPLKGVLRLANQKDDEQEAANRQKEREAFKICIEKIKKHDLQMKLIDAEYTFDNNKVLFYFTADGRIDFRELVKDLASVFKTRIELRQIGVRDETKILGGIGICGRALCCHTYLSEFAPVSIKMAKEQNLSLNPTKISGVCGRLMCCLKNEEETYEELNRKLPNTGDYVTTEDGLKGEVQSVNVLRQLVKVVVDVGDEKEIKEFRADQLRFKKRVGKNRKMDVSEEELKELEQLEEQGDTGEEGRSEAERREQDGLSEDAQESGDGEQSGGESDERGNEWENRDRGHSEQGRDRGQGERKNQGRDRGYGEREGRDRFRRERDNRDRNYGDQEGRDRSYGERDNRDKGYGEREGRDRSYGERDNRDKGYGEREGRDRSYGERDNRDKSYGERDNRDRSYGERDNRGRSYGGRDNRDRSYGEREGRGGYGGQNSRDRRDRGYRDNRDNREYRERENRNREYRDRNNRDRERDNRDRNNRGRDGRGRDRAERKGTDR